MPNTISQQDLENLDLSEIGRALKLGWAGAIRPLDSEGRCRADVDDLFGCVLYAQVVEGRVMKFGTTSSFRNRMTANASTINDILLFQDGRILMSALSVSKRNWLDGMARGKGDAFMKKAPAVIRDGKRIDVWATSLCSPIACPNKGRKNSRCAACKDMESVLNGRYQTIQHGWVLRLS